MKKLQKFARLSMILLLAISISVNLASIKSVSTDSLQSPQTQTIANSNVSTQAQINEYNISPIEDSFVEVTFPDDNDGAEHYLEFGQASDVWLRIWLKFDVSGIPEGTQIGEVRLYMYHVYGETATEGPKHRIRVHYSTNNSWDENTITWNNQPDFEEDVIGETELMVDANGHIVEGWYFWNITEKFKEVWTNGILTFALNPYAGPNGLWVGSFYSKENGENTPYLLVFTDPPPDLTASISPSLAVLNPGETETFTCLANGGSPPYTYQWLVNGGDTGYTSNQYTFMAQLEQMGTTVQIQCIVTDSLSNRVFPEAQAQVKIPHGLIDTDKLNGTKTRVGVELFHDGQEVDPNWDYFAVRVTVADPPVIELPQHHPLYVKVHIEMPDFCEEFPDNHQPQTGSYGRLPVSYGFSYYGIGFSITPPAYYVSYNREYVDGKLVMEWDVNPSKIHGIASGFLFYDYTTYAVGVRVPEGYKPTAQVWVEVVYYKKYDWLIPIYYDKLTDTVAWAVVDPPGAEPITPMEPDPINSPVNVTIVSVNSITYQGGWSNPTATVKPGADILINVNYTCGLDSPLVLTLMVYDSAGELIQSLVVKWSGMGTGTWTIEDYGSLPEWAHPGLGFIQVSLYTALPLKGGIEYLPETIVPIEIMS